MISKETIKKTVVCYWSVEHESFVAESAMLPHVVIGVGESYDLAMRSFDEALDDAYDDIAGDNLAGYTKGRPAKGYVPLNVTIRPATRLKLSQMAESMGISQGEAIHYLVFYHECKSESPALEPSQNQVAETLRRLQAALENGFVSMEKKLNSVEAKVDRQTVSKTTKLQRDSIA